MMIKNRYIIVVVDKKGKFPFLFQGLRKHKYTVLTTENVDEISSIEVSNFNLFFVVLYEFRDVFELLILNRIYKTNIPIILASENSKIIKKINKIACYPIVDLSGKVNINISFHDVLKEYL